jgi:hypothetical protein
MAVHVAIARAARVFAVYRRNTMTTNTKRSLRAHMAKMRAAKAAKAATRGNGASKDAAAAFGGDIGAAVKALRNNISYLPHKDRVFANSLLSVRGGWSAKQLHWVFILAAAAFRLARGIAEPVTPKQDKQDKPAPVGKGKAADPRDALIAAIDLKPYELERNEIKAMMALAMDTAVTKAKRIAGIKGVVKNYNHKRTLRRGGEFIAYVQKGA